MFRRRRADPAGSVQSFQYPLSRLAKATNNFSDRNKIGSGGSGVVYKGKIDGREVAIKKLHGSSIQRLVDVANEVSLLCSLEHDNLVKLLGFSSEDGQYLLVYEYIPNGDLYSYLSDEGKRTKLNWEMRFNIINGIASGLSYLHHDLMDSIIHRDLKPENVLLDIKYNAKIADFGLSKSFAKNKTHNTTRNGGGTYGYIAPELWNLKRYSSKSDVYNFGLLILEIIAGCTSPAYERRNGGKLLHHEVWRRWKNKEPLIEVIDQSLRNQDQQDLIKHCILIGLHCVQDDFNKRPKMEDVLEMLNNTINVLREPDKPGFFGGPEDLSNIIEFQSTEATCANSEFQRTGHAIPEDNSTKLYSIKDLMIATNFFSRFEHGDYHSVIWLCNSESTGYNLGSICCIHF
ncbi:cysteine-rich RECEPTOR-like kinase [Rhynchospora pubera]|uniref:non-specific serine/threonine protein kinase n=1 Tax=Rhynchospora pubera TaxID=906938 RepID=A0AAV8GTK3_9POAL|nr:cysteine-rich RECEPTOR-like kinase [Rhynchospora pubera]